MTGSGEENSFLVAVISILFFLLAFSSPLKLSLVSWLFKLRLGPEATLGRTLGLTGSAVRGSSIAFEELLLLNDSTGLMKDLLDSDLLSFSADLSDETEICSGGAGILIDFIMGYGCSILGTSCLSSSFFSIGLLSNTFGYSSSIRLVGMLSKVLLASFGRVSAAVE